MAECPPGPSSARLGRACHGSTELAGAGVAPWHGQPGAATGRAVAVVCLAIAAIAATPGCSEQGELDPLAAELIEAPRSITADDGASIGFTTLRAAGRGDAGEFAAGALREAQGGPRGKATAVLLHPMMVDRDWFLPLGRRLARAGWDVVLPDLRRHGHSGGARTTWGAREKHDIRRIIDCLLEDNLVSSEVYAMGASLGGCVAVQYAAVDPRCRGVLALAPPTGVEGYIRCTWPLATDEFIRAAIARECQEGGYRPEDASAVAAARQLRCPLIVVHGRLDVTVPVRQGEEVHAAAAGPKKMIYLWADHGGVQMGRDAWLAERMEELRRMSQ